jgi:PAS domain S-box-containing protein
MDDSVLFRRDAIFWSPLATAAVEGLEYRLCDVNPALCQLLGESREALLGLPFGEAIVDDEGHSIAALLDRVRATLHPESLPDRRHPDREQGDRYWSYTVWSVPDADDSIAALMVQITDTTDAVLWRQKTEALNQVLLLNGLKQHTLTESAESLNARLLRGMRETNHRIKNNLQVVAALVALHIGSGDSVSDARLRSILRHIRILATLHDLLTQQARAGSSIQRVSVREVLEHLDFLLEETSGGRLVTASIADIELSVQQVAALSFIMSECVSNAIKHARGTIEITLRVVESHALLEVCDDGDGFLPNFDPSIQANTGLELIDSIVRFDLRGTVTYANRPIGGGRVTVTFPCAAA